MLNNTRFLAPLMCLSAVGILATATLHTAAAQSFFGGSQTGAPDSATSEPRRQIGPTAYTLDATPRSSRSSSGAPTLTLPPATAPVIGLGATTSGSDRLLREPSQPSPMTLGLPRVPVEEDRTGSAREAKDASKPTSTRQRPVKPADAVKLPSSGPKQTAENVAGQRISGKASVVDGDTMLVGSRLVRLHGVDAPHLRQTCLSGVSTWPCGERSARRLSELADGREVSCVVTVPAGEGVAAVCRTAEGDLAKAMVRDGMAAVARWIPGGYANVEDQARAARRGMWAGSFSLPWLWKGEGAR